MRTGGHIAHRPLQNVVKLKPKSRIHKARRRRDRLDPDDLGLVDLVKHVVA